MANNQLFKVKNGLQAGTYLQNAGTSISTTLEYDISIASYDSKSFSATTQAPNAKGVEFKDDGSAMYVCDTTSGAIFQYTLSTAWDVSTASYASKSANVSGQASLPYDVFFKPDGTKMYVLDFSGDTIYQYSLSTAWDVSTASYDSVSQSVSSQDAGPTALSFKTDGTKMYVCGQGSDSVHQYSLSVAWDLSTASYDSVAFDFSTEETIPWDMFFIPDGTKMYIMGRSSDEVHQYSLSTAWDVSTASYDDIHFGVFPEGAGNSSSLTFSSDGLKMYMLEDSNDTIYQYSVGYDTEVLDLSTGSVFDVTPTSDVQITLSNPASSGNVSGATLLLSASGTAYTITYDPSIKWDGGTAPTSPDVGETDAYVFFTTDGGTTYYGKQAGDAVQ